MRFSSSAAALAAAALLWGAAATGLTLSQAATPAEAPPPGFSKEVFVDSRGCVYVRASIGSTVNWVPRLSRDRKTVICGMTPSASVAAAPAAGAAAPPEPPAPPAPPPVAAAPPAPAASAPAPAPAARAPAARAAAPAPAPTPKRTAHLPAPSAAAPAAAAPPPAPSPGSSPAPEGFDRTLAVTCTADGSALRVRIGGDTVKISCPAGMSRDVAYIVTHGDGSRSRLIAHPAPATRTAAAPAAPGPDVIIGNRAPGEPNTAFGNGYGFSHDYPPQDPVPGIATAGRTAPVAPVAPAARATPAAPAPTAQAGARNAGDGIFEATPGPGSPAPSIPAGYRPAWDDDRLNPNRGPRSGSATAPMPQARGAAKPAAGNAASATMSRPRYVQVGAFRQAGNARNAVANIQRLGMSAATSHTRSGLTQVLAGPFTDPAELQRALRTLRGHYPDAYTRG